MVTTVFVEIGIIILIATVIAGIMRLLRQPLIIGYILTGIIVSPYFLNIVKTTETFETFAQIGIALLLFMVGLSLNPKTIKEIGKVSLVTGIGQVVFTSVIGFFIAKALGFSNIISIYVAVALTFSSTIIIMKLLSDKDELNTLHGKISVGFLIVQDLIVVIILMAVSAFQTEVSTSTLIMNTILKGSMLLITIFLIGFYILPHVVKRVARSQEFLLLFSIGWAFIVASIFYYLNFSLEIGALIAGMTLAISPYRYEISSRMKPLRDFFIILFFVLLGSQIVFSNITQYIIPIIIFSLFILIGNPIIVMLLMKHLGYKKRNSFLTGLSVAQISEFSIIFVALGVSVGHITQEILSMVTLIGLITIAGSSYMILNSKKLYDLLSKYLDIFEKKNIRHVDDQTYHQDQPFPIILFGYNRIGYDILESVKKTKERVLIIDYNPETIEQLIKEGFNCVYGDAFDSELLNELKLKQAKMIISTIPDVDASLLLINKVRGCNKKAIIIVISHQIDETLRLYEAGATYVIMPHFLGGHHIASMIEDYKLDLSKFLKKKTAHIKELRKKKRMKHEHPKHERK